MSSNPMLAALPEGLIEEIAQHVESQDLLALKQVSRAIAFAIDRQFLDTFFTSRSHLYTLHGVQALADIADHDRLIHRMQSITLVFLRLNNASADNRGPPRTRWEEQNDALHRDELHIRLLTKIFNSIAAGPHSKSLEITITTRCLGREYGAANIKTHLDLSSLITIPADIGESIKLLLPLLSSIKGLAPTALHILPDGILPPQSFDLDRPLDKDLALASNLRTLQVDLGPVYYHLVPIDARPLRQQSLLTFLRAAVSLKTLTISGYGGWTSSGTHDDSLFRVFAEHIPTEAPLLRLELAWFDICEKDLAALLKRMSSKLTHLSLRELTLAKDERWDDLLSIMESQLRLEELKLYRLRCDDEEFADVPDRLNQLTLSILDPTGVEPVDASHADEDDDDGSSGVRQNSAFTDAESVRDGLRMLMVHGAYTE